MRNFEAFSPPNDVMLSTTALAPLAIINASGLSVLLWSGIALFFSLAQ